MMYIAQKNSTAIVDTIVKRQSITKTTVHTHRQGVFLKHAPSACVASHAHLRVLHSCLGGGRGGGARQAEVSVVHPLRGGGRRRGMEERNPEDHKA